MLQPFIISALLDYFEGKINVEKALLYGLLLSCCITITCIIHHPYFVNVVLIGIRARIACSGLIYKKVLYFLKFNILN